MKNLFLLVLFGTISLVLTSCTPSRRAGLGYGPYVGYGPYGIYPSYIYDDAPGGWDIYKSRGSTRVKYTE